MPLTMRPTGLGSGIDKHLYCGGWDVGRIYETRGRCVRLYRRGGRGDPAK